MLRIFTSSKNPSAGFEPANLAYNRRETRDKWLLGRNRDRSWCRRHTTSMIKLFLVTAHGSMHIGDRLFRVLRRLGRELFTLPSWIKQCREPVIGERPWLCCHVCNILWRFLNWKNCCVNYYPIEYVSMRPTTVFPIGTPLPPPGVLFVSPPKRNHFRIPRLSCACANKLISLSVR